jgi:DNA-binding NarL/FixJ family response regulator
MKKRIRILILDNQVIVRAGLMSILDKDARFTVVGGAGSLRKAIETEIITGVKPDVIIIDPFAREFGGVRSIKKILAHFPKVRLLVFTYSSDKRDFLDALAYGVSGYLLKSASPIQIRSAIENVIYQGKN